MDGTVDGEVEAQVSVASEGEKDDPLPVPPVDQWSTLFPGMEQPQALLDKLMS